MTTDFRQRAEAIAKRIPLTLTMHLSADRCHSHRYTNTKLGIGAEVHVHGKSFAGYFEPSKRKKPTKLFYLENDNQDFPALVDLLIAFPLVLQKAEKKYGETP